MTTEEQFNVENGLRAIEKVTGNFGLEPNFEQHKNIKENDASTQAIKASAYRCYDRIRCKLKMASFLGVAMLALPGIASAAVAVGNTYESEDYYVAFTNAYEPIWTDKGSGADREVSFWRPVPPAGFRVVGDHAKSGHAYPDTYTMVIKEKRPGLIHSPHSFTKSWSDVGSGTDKDVAIWRPSCPNGTTAMGEFAVAGVRKDRFGFITPLAAPSPQVNANSFAYCIDLAHEFRTTSTFIWNDIGSGADQNAGVWGISSPLDADTAQYLTRGLFYTSNTHTRPNDAPIFGAIQIVKANNPGALISDELTIGYTQSFDEVWNDGGSGADDDVSFHKPIMEPGYSFFGHYAKGSHGPVTNRGMMIVKAKKNDGTALRKPLTFQRVWDDDGSGVKNRDVVVWRPRCEPNYVSLGLITTKGSIPSRDSGITCIRRDLVAVAGASDKIWDDSGSGADDDFSAWNVASGTAPAGEAYVAPGTFVGQASHSKPNTNLYVLKFKLPEIRPSSNKQLTTPVLTSHARPLDLQTQTATYEVIIPFSAVKDPQLNHGLAASLSPYYRLVRTDQYKLIDHVYNNTSASQSVSWWYSTAVSNSESFESSTGISLTAGYETTVGSKVAGSSSTYSVSLTLSQGFTYTTASSTTVTTRQVIPIVAPSGVSVAAYTVQSSFRLYRADGSAVDGLDPKVNQPKASTVFVQYPAPSS